MTKKMMTDSLMLVFEDGVESQLQVEDSSGNLSNFYVNIPWDDAREAALISNEISKDASNIIREQLYEHGDKINQLIADKVSSLSEINDNILFDSLNFYFENQDVIHWLINWVKAFIQSVSSV